MKARIRRLHAGRFARALLRAPRATALSVGLAAATMLGVTGVARGQQVSGRVSAVDGSPVPWALVHLVDSSGEHVASDVTTARGTFLLFAPAPGTFRVRTERIGFKSALSDPLDLARGERHLVNLTAPDAPIELAAIDVRSSGGSCGLQPEEGSDLLTIWGEIEKALALQTATSESGLYRFHLEVYEYVTNHRGRPADPREAKKGTRELVLRGSQAFQAEDPELLVERGFHWNDRTFYAPTASTLLSEPFQRTHCYRPRRKDGRLGVEFEPESTRGVVEIKGTLWLDESGKLSSLEYEYVADKYEKPPMDGGYIEFEQLPEGAWIVRRWYIRVPTDYRGMSRHFVEAGGRILNVERVRTEASLASLEVPERAAGPIPPPVPLPEEIAARLSPYAVPPDSAAVAEVLARHPDFASSPAGEAVSARAGLWRRAGLRTRALSELESVSPGDPRRGLVEVERARSLFGEDEPVDATSAFWAACASDEKLALEALWADLKSLATEEEFRRWRTVRDGERCDLLSEMVVERAWRAGIRVRDRLALHYDRLELARREWRLPAPRGDGGTVDRFGWRPEVEFDDRGLIFVRMGRPGQIDRAMVRRSSQTGYWIESWQYDRPGGNRMLFFEAPMHRADGVVDFRLLDEPWLAAEGDLARDEMEAVTDMAIAQAVDALTEGGNDDVYESLGGIHPHKALGIQPRMRVGDALLDALRERREESVADLQFVLDSIPDAPELFPSVQFGWEHLRFFEPASGNTTLWVLVAVLAGDLQRIVDEDGWSDYRANVTVAALDGTGVSTDSVQTVARLPRELPPESGLVAGVSVSAPPGVHPFTVVVKDGHSQGLPTGNWRRGSVTGIVPTERPELSDIAVAADSGGAFSRDGETYLAVSPSHVTNPDGGLHVYFEVYGVPAGAPYTVELRVLPEKLADRIWQLSEGRATLGLSLPSEMPASGGIGAHHLRIDLSDSPPGDYTIGIRVTEDGTGRQSLPASTRAIRTG